MKKFLLAMLGTALAGGMAYAQEEPLDPTQDPTQDQPTEYGEEAGEWDEQDPMSQTEDPTQSEWEEQDPMSETEDPTQSEMDDPTMSEMPPEDSTYGQESGQEQQPTTEDPMTSEEEMTSEEDMYGQESGMQHDISSMSAEELKGMSLVSDTGEEIGQIDRVGHERVVTVDVGGFLGVGEKTVAIPVSELQVSADGSLQTTLTKEELEARAEFNEQGFEEEGSQSESTSY